MLKVSLLIFFGELVFKKERLFFSFFYLNYGNYNKVIKMNQTEGKTKKFS